MVGRLDFVNWLGGLQIMITLEQLNTVLANQGKEIDAITGQCIVDMVNAKEDCLMEKLGNDCMVMMAQLLASQIISLNMGGRVITAESVDVVRISYKAESMADVQKGMYYQIVQMGIYSCFSDIVPKPIDAPTAWFGSGVASCAN